MTTVNKTRQAVAVVGASVRLPGKIGTVTDFWRELLSPGEPRPLQFRDGDDCGFDNRFFAISAAEAAAIDPHHKLAIELAWEALENSGVKPSDVAGTRTAVFASHVGADHMIDSAQVGVGPWFGSGGEPSFASGRIAYLLGTRGPVLNLSTACSSSLVGVHLARQSLLLGECDRALVCGLSLHLNDLLTDYMRSIGAISSTSKCRPFSADADGMVRGEGGVVVVLRRLEDAIADRDDVIAVIEGSAVNHDGASAGLTTPSAEAQSEVIRAALTSAKVEPDQVAFIEAHGTGTAAGDWTEIGALAEVFEKAGTFAPVLIGSAKSVFGHLDAAAGLVGLLKAALVCQRRVVPVQLDARNARAELAAEPNLAMPECSQPIGDVVEFAVGVSSFGLSGTNCHVILTPPPTVAKERTPDEHPLVLPVSARSPESVSEFWQRMDRALANVRPQHAYNFCATAATSREAEPWRDAVIANSLSDLRRRVRERRLSTVAKASGELALVFGSETISGMPYHLKKATADDLPTVPDAVRDIFMESISRYRDLLSCANFFRDVTIAGNLTFSGIGFGALVAEVAASSKSDADLEIVADIRAAAIAYGEPSPSHLLIVAPKFSTDSPPPVLPGAIAVEGENALQIVIVDTAQLDELVIEIERAGLEVVDDDTCDPIAGVGIAAARKRLGTKRLQLPVSASTATLAVSTSISNAIQTAALSEHDTLVNAINLDSNGQSVAEFSAIAHRNGLTLDWSQLQPVLVSRSAQVPPTPWEHSHEASNSGKINHHARRREDDDQPSAPSQPVGDRDQQLARPVGGNEAVGEAAVAANVSRQDILAVLAEVVADGREIPLATPFADLGVDSVGMVELARRLSASLGMTITPTELFDHPNAAALLESLQPMLSDTPSRQSVDSSAQRADTAPQKVAQEAAIIGMACRGPLGIASPNDLWSALEHGVDAIREPDPNRFVAGQRWPGGYLNEPMAFDAGFFGITAGEAEDMDPQQRQLLEVVWEAIEDAGIRASSLCGSRAGVFIGISSSDYQMRVVSGGTVAAGPYFGTGTSHSASAGRIAYFLGTTGPCMAIDTACSSSLTATHLALRSLRSQECEIAIVAGVNVISGPEIHQSSAAGGALAADGRCKSFSADADGYTRAEGCGALVLRRLTEAEHRGDRIYAILAGTAVNQDGASNGFTAPSPTAQREVIARAVADAGIDVKDVGYIEAHGTGTRLGDPIELDGIRGALSMPTAHFGGQRYVGSIKSNIGHTEAASGVFGLIKAAQVLDKRCIPASLHCAHPTDAFDWETAALAVPSRSIEWTADSMRAVGVSSFGFTGSNAHAILREHAMPSPTAAATEIPSVPAAHVAAVSAATGSALAVQAAALSKLLDGADGSRVAQVCAASQTRRDQLGHRAAVAGRTGDELAAELRSLADTDAERGDRFRRASGAMSSPVFVFSGYGSQWDGMAERGSRGATDFIEHLHHISDAVGEITGWSVAERLHSGEYGPSEADQQILIFVIQVALTDWLASVGVSPAAVVGHSMGEAAAAYAAGVLDLSDAARLSGLRARLLSRVVGHGGMIFVRVGIDPISEVLETISSTMEVAVVNTHGAVVLTGTDAEVDAIATWARDNNVYAQRVRAGGPGHSRVLDSYESEFISGASELSFKPPRIPYYSAVAGAVVSELDSHYFWRNLRHTVRFADAVDALLVDGYREFLELSPAPLLTRSITEIAAAAGHNIGATESLRRDSDLAVDCALILASAYCRWGVSDFLPNTQIPVVALPKYQWRHRDFTKNTQVQAQNVPEKLWNQNEETRSNEYTGPEDDYRSDPPKRSASEVTDLIMQRAADVLLVDEPSEIRADRGFFEIGFTSVTGMELKVALERDLKITLDNGVVFDFPTPVALGSEISRIMNADQHRGHGDTESATASTPGPASTTETVRTAQLEDTGEDSDPLTSLLAEIDSARDVLRSTEGNE